MLFLVSEVLAFRLSRPNLFIFPCSRVADVFEFSVERPICCRDSRSRWIFHRCCRCQTHLPSSPQTSSSCSQSARFYVPLVWSAFSQDIISQDDFFSSMIPQKMKSRRHVFFLTGLCKIGVESRMCSGVTGRTVQSIEIFVFTSDFVVLRLPG